MNLLIKELFAARNFMKKVVAQRRYRIILQGLSKWPPPLKLNVGCGKIKFPGWINIDADPALPGLDIYWDVTNGLPVEDSSCLFIYCEHFLEHLHIEAAIRFLQECHRALQPNGRLRIAMPDLGNLLERAVSENWREQDWLTWPEFRHIATRAEMLNISFYSWGHKWLYDREELHRRLKQAGFEQIEDKRWGESAIDELCHRETRKDSLLICEVKK